MAERHCRFFCDLCDKKYDFQSRYDRHLASAGHRRLELLFKHQPADTSPSTSTARPESPLMQVEQGPSTSVALAVSRLSCV